MNFIDAKDIMTKNVLMANADWPVKQLAEFLVEHSISGAPVVCDDGKLIGAVTLTDIAQHTGTGQNLNSKISSKDSSVSSFNIPSDITTHASDIMTPVIFNVYENTSIKDVAQTMLKGRIRRVFVTRDKKVVGVISSQDMLKVISDTN